MQTYAIGDIHGHFDLLRGVHDLIADDMARHGAGQVVHVGDLVDRGPASAAVVEYLRCGIEAGQDWVVLRSNHDRLFTTFMADPALRDPCLRADLSWLHPKIGGAETLRSYGVRSAGDRPIEKVHADARGLVPQADVEFLNSRPAWHRANGVIFVHAGVRPGIAIEHQSEDDLCWIRAGFLDHDGPFEALIVHGHTAIDVPTHYGNRVNIDSSAAYGGPLSVVVIEEGEVFHLTTAGRVPLQPPQAG
ncbi:metallophosphoesterase [Pseudotabrizicola algicola]|uniref:Serine/threonine protein phosphatase n=1 Tax=Pseudotabrizicola algicola TaxID=2709381 RepID=A0A6B3RJD4_9RHOB|nr:metallophosphoesterase [Pseudotabrizicola algicola]NEX46144.1 serine/threonine protein phosphatase [Pseudotabrizicola algicola]